MISNFIAATIAFVAILLFAFFGGSNALGAHHFWDIQTAIYGAPAGAIVAAILARVWSAKTIRVLLFGVLAAAAFGLAHYGKLQFAASYGDDALAGKLWYFGWIGTSAAAAALLTSVLAR